LAVSVAQTFERRGVEDGIFSKPYMKRPTSKLTGLQRLGAEGAQFVCAWSAQPLQVRLNAQLGVARAKAGNWRTAGIAEQEPA